MTCDAFPYMSEQKLKAEMNQATLAFVRRPKCVWYMEMQTKTSASGTGSSLEKYNSKAVMSLKRMTLHKGAAPRC